MASIANEVCRFCLQYTEPVFDIFSDSLQERNILFKIKTHLDLDISYDQTKDKCICASCLKIIDEFALYYKQVKLNQDNFLDIEEEYLSDWKEDFEKAPSSDEKDSVSWENTNVECVFIEKNDEAHDEETTIEENYVYDELYDHKDSLEIMLIEDHDYEMIEVAEIKEEPVDYVEDDDDKDAPKTASEDEYIVEDEYCIKELGNNTTKSTVDSEVESIESDEDEFSMQDTAIDETMSGESQTEQFFTEYSEEYPTFPKTLVRDGELLFHGQNLSDLINRFFKLECDICPKNLFKDSAFTKIPHIMGHYKLVHQIKGYVKCCNIKLFKKGDMALHMVSHIQPDAFKCKQCQKTCGTLRGLREHIASHGKGVNNINFDEESDEYPGFPKTLIKDGDYIVQGSALTQLINKFYTLKCEICVENSKNYTFKKVSYLLAHYQMIHDIPGYVTCCNIKIYKRHNMAMHMTRHLQPDALKCTHCGKICPSVKGYKDHVEAHASGHTPLTGFNCEICGIRCATQHFLEIHKKKMHSKKEVVELSDESDCLESAMEPHPDYPDFPKRIYNKRIKKIIKGPKLAVYVKKFYKFACDKCPEDDNNCFEDHHQLFKHYQDVHNERGYVSCCSMKLKTYQYLIYHMAYHLQPDMFKCPVCGKLHTKPDGVREHMQTHQPTESKTYYCPKCPNRYGSQSGLRKHMICHIPEDQREKHPCKECGKTFSNLGACQTHYKYCHVNQKLICETCGKMYKHNVALNMHKRTHVKKQNGEKQRVSNEHRDCEICGLSFANKPSVYKHMDEAHGRVHKCELCPYVGNKWVLFARHMKECHTEKPHVCSKCGRSFKFYCTLRDHILQHNRALLHFCELCNKKYYSQSGLRRHQLREHLNDYTSILNGRKARRKGRKRPREIVFIEPEIDVQN